MVPSATRPTKDPIEADSAAIRNRICKKAINGGSEKDNVNYLLSTAGGKLCRPLGEKDFYLN